MSNEFTPAEVSLRRDGPTRWKAVSSLSEAACTTPSTPQGAWGHAAGYQD